MRNSIAKIVLLGALCCTVACDKFDDSKIWDELNKMTDEVTALQNKYDAMNAELSTIKTIVQAIQGRDYVKSITPLPDGSGYKLTLVKYGDITIKHGEKGDTGSTPQIGVRKDTDGVYYWTLDREWLLDNGQKVRAEGVDGAKGTDPKLKIENDYWYVSCDNGKSWQQLGKAKGETGIQGNPGTSLIQSVDISDPDVVIIVLVDGTILRLSRELPVRLDEGGSANCYIVTQEGRYKFLPIQGNSQNSVGEVASVEVVWESFGTDTAPSVGDLVREAYYANGYVYFTASDKRGNALIAAKDAEGKILWSWHIWMTSQPEDQVYYNNAGTMMDRNLGATSATPGDVKALGLLYQWGRKDPFLGGAVINFGASANQQQSLSTLTTWPEPVTSDSSTGTIEYAQEHPTTFISGNTNYDWLYSSSSSIANTRWQSTKTIYDPCPAGYRVPDGGSNGAWATAIGSTSSFTYPYESTNKGMNLSGKLGSSVIMWFPFTGYIYDGKLNFTGYVGYYWTVTINSGKPYNYILVGNSGTGMVASAVESSCVYAFSVRCCKE